MVCMGLVHDFSGLAAARFFLGMFEAGLFPGVNYYLSCWYKRSEFGIRAAVFFSAAALAGSFGGLLAAAIIQMRGVGGKAGWAWLVLFFSFFLLLTTMGGMIEFMSVLLIHLLPPLQDLHPRRLSNHPHRHRQLLDGPRLPHRSHLSLPHRSSTRPLPPTRRQPTE